MSTFTGKVTAYVVKFMKLELQYRPIEYTCTGGHFFSLLKELDLIDLFMFLLFIISGKT